MTMRIQCGFNPEAMPDASIVFADSMRKDRARVPERHVREDVSARNQTPGSGVRQPTEWLYIWRLPATLRGLDPVNEPAWNL